MEYEPSSYDIAKEVQDFEETKAGVKGLVDSGITKIPNFFIQPPERISDLAIKNLELQVPLIDFDGLDQDFRRLQIVKEVREACETWGFFQMVNHGVPVKVMDNLLEAIRGFHELPKEVKMEWYSRVNKVRYYCSEDLLMWKSAVWRDSIGFDFTQGPLEPETIPSVSREGVLEFHKHIKNLREVLSGLLSEALGLPTDYLEHLEFMKTETLVSHYSPSCPQPELTLSSLKHSDPSSFSVVFQDHIGGLQVLHQGHWVDVPPTPGSLVANVGDLMHLLTDGKFKSVEHRVQAGRVGPRISGAYFFYPSAAQLSKPIGPIKELRSENQPIYRTIDYGQYITHFASKGLGNSALPYFKLA